MGRKIRPGFFIRLNDFLPWCHVAIAEQGPHAVLIHEHTRKQDPRCGRIEMAPGLWSQVLGRDANSGQLLCECSAQGILDAHADGRLLHREPRKTTS